MLYEEYIVIEYIKYKRYFFFVVFLGILFFIIDGLFFLIFKLVLIVFLLNIYILFIFKNKCEIIYNIKYRFKEINKKLM